MARERMVRPRGPEPGVGPSGLAAFVTRMKPLEDSKDESNPSCAKISPVASGKPQVGLG